MKYSPETMSGLSLTTQMILQRIADMFMFLGQVRVLQTAAWMVHGKL